jgi:hypothetical protein
LISRALLAALALGLGACSPSDVFTKESHGTLSGVHGCACFIAVTDNKLTDVNVDCTATFGTFSVAFPMPADLNMTSKSAPNQLTFIISDGAGAPSGPLSGTFSGNVKLEPPKEELSQVGDKWLYFPMHAELELPKQRWCSVNALLDGHSCTDPQNGYELELGTATFEGQCEAFLIISAGQHWP